MAIQEVEPFSGYQILHIFVFQTFKKVAQERTAESRKVGRPAFFKSVAELQTKIDAYFESIKGDGMEVTESGRVIWEKEPEPATITGMALFLGFESRKSILDYESNGEFAPTIKKARLRIEAEYEKALFNKNPAGPIFALKNFGWDDKKQVEHSGELSVPLIEWVQREKE